MAKKRILSGMRPTGKLHLGNYVGALENWIQLQDEYDSYHLVADYHVLTTDLSTNEIYDNTIEMVIDWLSAGLDPQKAPMFRQSQIKEHTELFLIFSMLITKARLERNPTLKEQVRDLNIENLTYGHLGYPVLQAVDILLYKGDVVPVGEDQLPHIEITREIARRFNQQYSPDAPVFPEPEGKITQFARLPGLDGKRMSKSLGNTIFLSDEPEVVTQKLRKAVTDPQKVRKNDPGRPEICLVFTYHQKFNAGETQEMETNCRSGALGCVECKLKCASKINEILAPIIYKRKGYEKNLNSVVDVLNDGEDKARKVAQATMSEVRDKMKMG
ncbi:MAG: tryptophan--tRNA ligase [Melioribacteraceae bacterium]|nr:tryptophan--tRNA ligase [Melioribacteraceae bacterium]